MTPLRRFGVPIVGFGVCLAVCGWLLHRFYTDLTFLPPDDFLQYWAAGRLASAGENPYDADSLIALQTTAGRDEASAILNWQPPWALAVCLPYGPFGPRTAQLLWTLSQSVLLAGSAVWLWRLVGGSWRLGWVPLGIALTSPGTMVMVHSGQCGGWLVLGVVGWYAAVRTGSLWYAGLVALCALKPHLFGPLWVAMALDALRGRQGRLRLAVAGAAVVLMVAVVLAVDPGVWGQYLDALRKPRSAAHRPLSTWEPPLVGFWLRNLINFDLFALQFVPALLALTGTTFYLCRRPGWSLTKLYPGLICLGLLAAPYSGWVFDLVLLAVPAVLVAVKLDGPRAKWVTAGWLAITAATIAIGVTVYNSSVLVWVTPSVWLLVWLAGRPGGGAYHDPCRPDTAVAAVGERAWANPGGWLSSAAGSAGCTVPAPSAETRNST